MEILFFVIPAVVIALIISVVARKQKGISKEQDPEKSLLRQIERNTFVMMIVFVISAVCSIISVICTIMWH